MNPDSDKTMENALAPSPVEREPSDELMRRLRTMAREKPRRTWWRSGRALPFAMVAGTVAVVFATTMIPAKASAKSFDMVVRAAQRINAFQFSILTDESPKREALTIAGSDGHVYLQTDGDGSMEIGPNGISAYDRKANKLTRFKFGNLVDPATAAQMAGAVQSELAAGLKEMDLKKVLEEYRRKYAASGVHVSPVEREDGRDVYHVLLASPSEPERVEMTVDAATDLPETLEVATQEGGRWKRALRMEMRFGARVESRLLRSPVPAGAKVEEIDLGAMVGDATKEIGKTMENLGKQLASQGARLKGP